MLPTSTGDMLGAPIFTSSSPRSHLVDPQERGSQLVTRAQTLEQTLLQTQARLHALERDLAALQTAFDQQWHRRFPSWCLTLWRTLRARLQP